jgi:hypothetical protein
VIDENIEVLVDSSKGNARYSSANVFEHFLGRRIVPQGEHRLEDHITLVRGRKAELPAQVLKGQEWYFSAHASLPRIYVAFTPRSTNKVQEACYACATHAFASAVPPRSRNSPRLIRASGPALQTQ